MSVRSKWFMVMFKSSIPLLIFCLVVYHNWQKVKRLQKFRVEKDVKTHYHKLMEKYKFVKLLEGKWTLSKLKLATQHFHFLISALEVPLYRRRKHNAALFLMWKKGKYIKGPFFKDWLSRSWYFTLWNMIRQSKKNEVALYGIDKR